MILNYLCRLFSGRCAGEPPKANHTRPTPDLGQKEAKSEARSDEQFAHMEGDPAANAAKQQKKA